MYLKEDQQSFYLTSILIVFGKSKKVIESGFFLLIMKIHPLNPLVIRFIYFFLNVNDTSEDCARENLG